ncbi:unnamed protein product, partial [Amoebophrya sp. A25]
PTQQHQHNSLSGHPSAASLGSSGMTSNMLLSKVLHSVPSYNSVGSTLSSSNRNDRMDFRGSSGSLLANTGQHGSCASFAPFASPTPAGATAAASDVGAFFSSNSISSFCNGLRTSTSGSSNLDLLNNQNQQVQVQQQEMPRTSTAASSIGSNLHNNIALSGPNQVSSSW